MNVRPVLLLIAGLGVMLLLLLAYCTVTGPSRQAARQSRDNATMAQTRTESALEAITEIGRLDDRGQATSTQVQEAQNAIRQAPPADRDRVARFQLCRLQHRADCDRLLGTGPVGPDAVNPAR